MEQFRFGRSNGMSFAKTGPDGRFTFDKPGGAYLLAAMSDDGYAEATPEELREIRHAHPESLGQDQGPGADRPPAGREPAHHLQPPRLPARRAGGVHAFYSIETRTDAQGHFAFDRVIPGASEVARVVVTEFGNGMQQHMGCWQEPVDVAPGQTAAGPHRRQGPAGGRPGRAAGRARGPRRLAAEPAGDDREAAGLQPVQGLLGQDPHQFDRFAANLDKDGRFRIDDVPPGRYELTVTIDAPAVPDRPGPVEELGRVKVPVDVPEGDDDVPVDLGEIKAEVKGR